MNGKTFCMYGDEPSKRFDELIIELCEKNKEIKSITLINDHFVSKTHGSVDYDWWETRVVIFNFGELEVSSEKQDSFFSME